MIQPSMNGWNVGLVNLREVNAITGIVSVTTNVHNALGEVTWWRNQLPGDTLTTACEDFWGAFPFNVMGTNNASCIATEYTPQGLPIQTQGFSFTYTDITLFGET